MNIIYWIIFGLITGFIANYFMPNTKGGVIGLIILGIIGAVVGGFIGERLFDVGVTGFNLSSFIVSIAGSILVLFVSDIIFRRTRI